MPPALSARMPVRPGTGSHPCPVTDPSPSCPCPFQPADSTEPLVWRIRPWYQPAEAAWASRSAICTTKPAESSALPFTWLKASIRSRPSGPARRFRCCGSRRQRAGSRDTSRPGTEPRPGGAGRRCCRSRVRRARWKAPRQRAAGVPRGEGVVQPGRDGDGTLGEALRTGRVRVAVEPSPTWPKPLKPHPHTVPSPRRARLCSPPAETATMPLKPGTRTGRGRSTVVPSEHVPAPGPHRPIGPQGEGVIGAGGNCDHAGQTGHLHRPVRWTFEPSPS